MAALPVNKRGLHDDPSFNQQADLKRLKSTPSKVVHVRGLPQFCQEHEVINLCRPFGNIVKTMFLLQKNQAFVQMESIEQAAMLIQHYTTMPPFVHSKPVYFQFSNHDEIQSNSKGAGSGESKTGEAPSVNHILLVTILNNRVPVTIENLYQVFSPYGGVRKIVTFMNKQNQFQALVEMNSTDAAITAKLSLEGKDMFQGCCTLSIGFSTMTELQVKQNGLRGRDFTVPDPAAFNPLASAQLGFPQQQSLMAGAGAFGFGAQVGGFHVAGMNPMGAAAAGFQPSAETAVVLVNNLVEEKVTPDALFTLFGVYGDVLRVKILYNKKDTALVQFASPQQAYIATVNLNRVNLYGKELNVRSSKHREVALPRPGQESLDMTRDYSDSPLHRFRRGGSKNAKNICPPSPVLFLSNLPDDVTKQDVLNIFGDGVLAVEFFKTNKNLAFVRMPSTEDAIAALIAHNNDKLRENYIRVSFSHKDPASVTGEGNA